MIRRATKGNKIAIRAEDWNAIADGIEKQKTSAPKKSPGFRSGEIWTKNTASAARPSFWIMAVRSDLFAPLITASGVLTASSSFAREIQYNLVDVTPSHTESYCILQSPIAVGALGMALSFGISQVKIDILDTSHQFAVLKSTQPAITESDPQPAQLESADSGGFRIISKPTSGTMTGELWCTVFFPVLDSDEDTIVTGSIAASAGDVVRTISSDAATGIVTVGTPDAASQPNIMILTSALTPGGYATATRRNDVMVNHDTDSEMAAGATLGTVSGSLKLKKGNSGMVCLAVPNLGVEVGYCRAGFYNQQAISSFSFATASYEWSTPGVYSYQSALTALASSVAIANGDCIVIRNCEGYLSAEDQYNGVQTPHANLHLNFHNTDGTIIAYCELVRGLSSNWDCSLNFYDNFGGVLIGSGGVATHTSISGELAGGSGEICFTEETATGYILP